MSLIPLHPYKTLCLSCQAAYLKVSVDPRYIAIGGPVACEKHQKEMMKEGKKKS